MLLGICAAPDTAPLFVILRYTVELKVRRGHVTSKFSLPLLSLPFTLLGSGPPLLSSLVSSPSLDANSKHRSFIVFEHNKVKIY